MILPIYTRLVSVLVSLRVVQRPAHHLARFENVASGASNNIPEPGVPLNVSTSSMPRNDFKSGMPQHVSVSDLSPSAVTSNMPKTSLYLACLQVLLHRVSPKIYLCLTCLRVLSYPISPHLRVPPHPPSESAASTISSVPGRAFRRPLMLPRVSLYWEAIFKRNMCATQCVQAV